VKSGTLSRVRIFVIAVLTSVAAQTPGPPPAAKPFAFALALEAAQAALGSCQPAGPAVVEVMDTAFNPKVVLVADGSRPTLIDFARRKAYTVIKKGMSSAEFGAQVGPQGRGAPPIEGDVNLITFGGGLPVRIGDELVAAIGVSGPNGPAADEACAKAGLEKIGDRLK
jgi:uncharacterized protein GlcG (DUF336 family)